MLLIRVQPELQQVSIQYLTCEMYNSNPNKCNIISFV